MYFICAKFLVFKSKIMYQISCHKSSIWQVSLQIFASSVVVPSELWDHI